MLSKLSNALHSFRVIQLTSLLLVSLTVMGKNHSTPACRAKVAIRSGNHKAVISAYYPGYNAKFLPPAKIPWKLYNHLQYFVAVPAPTPEADLVIDDEKNMLEVVAGAKSNSVSISLSVGGWTGSRFFSFLIGDSRNRTLFAETISRAVKKYKFDGVDLDWEYPNFQGLGCNALNKDDSKNFLAFLKVLRNKLGKKSRLSAAVSVHGFMSEDGKNYLKDVSEFGKVLDFITIMVYDIYGSSSKIAGPNAPLFSTCSDPASKFSASQAVKHWISTGIPAKKLILGIPSYGYAYTLKSNKLTETKFSGDSKKTSHLFQSTTGVPPKAGKTADVGGDRDACGNVNPPGGQWLFKELSGTKKLTSDAKKGLGGFERHYDSCTQTPFIFNPETRSLISYDDPTSFRAKAKFVLRHGLAGVEVFDATGDTDDNILLRSVRKVLA